MGTKGRVLVAGERLRSGWAAMSASSTAVRSFPASLIQSKSSCAAFTAFGCCPGAAAALEGGGGSSGASPSMASRGNGGGAGLPYVTAPDDVDGEPIQLDLGQPMEPRSMNN